MVQFTLFIGMKNMDSKPMVLGNTKPKGMCGSGIISALALFIRLGLIEESGRIRDPEIH